MFLYNVLDEHSECQLPLEIYNKFNAINEVLTLPKSVPPYQSNMYRTTKHSQSMREYAVTKCTFQNKQQQNFTHIIARIRFTRGWKVKWNIQKLSSGIPTSWAAFEKAYFCSKVPITVPWNFQIAMTNTTVFQEAAKASKLIAAEVTEVGRCCIWIHICATTEERR